ncbi:MAG: MFS transporter [Thermoanaerobaculia bacterium]
MVETKDIERDSASPAGLSTPPAGDGTAPLPATVVRLGWVSFLTDVSGEMIFPLIPAFLAGISGAPASALGWIEGVADATASTLKIVSGRLTDRAAKKKPLVLFGYGISSFVRPLVCFAASWPVVLGVRFLDRVGKGVRSAPRDTLIAAAAPPGRRGAAFGLHRAFDNAGAVLGPLVATALILWFGASFRTVFALSAIPAVLSVVVLVFGVKEAPSPASGDLKTATLAPLPVSFRRAVGVMALFTLSASSDGFLLLKARECGVSAGWLPVLWSGVNAIRAAFSLWGGGLSDRFGRKVLLGLAWLLYAGCYAAFASVTTIAGVSAVLAVYAMFGALSEGTERALIADLVPPESRGRAFGWMHGLTGFSALIASVAFGSLWDRFGSRTAFLVGAAPAALAALALVFFIPSKASAKA